MPIYDYVCSNCSTRTEFVHGIDAPAPRFCPTCGAEDTLRKVFVPPTVHFKGSGWAKKDRSSSSSSKTKAATAAGGDGTANPTSPADGGSGTADGDAGSSKKGPDSSAGTGAGTAKSPEA